VPLALTMLLWSRTHHGCLGHWNCKIDSEMIVS
jgi:hypothetical protein